MKIEKDPGKIAELAARKEDENWKFRSYLKCCDLESDQIDAIVHRLYKEVSEQIDCSACANCCKVLSPALNPEDCDRLAGRVGLPTEQFIKEYLTEAEHEEGYTLKTKPCPFLHENRCTVTGSRPKACDTFPYLANDGFVFRVIQAIGNCSVCPIVYNVFERLKIEIRGEIAAQRARDEMT